MFHSTPRSARWRTACGLIAFALLGFPPASAQSNLPSWPAPHAVAGAAHATTTLVADFDRNGVDDFAILEGGKGSNGAKVFSWFSHAGGRAFTEHKVNEAFLRDESLPFLGSAAVEDLSGDGYPDIVFTMDRHSSPPREGKVLWAENPGGDARGTWTIREIWHFTSETEHINDMALADFDDDGKTDIAVRHLGVDRVRLLYQDSLTAWELKTIDVPRREGMTAGNIDLDYKPDLVLNGFWLQNPGGDRQGDWVRYDIDPAFFTQDPSKNLNNSTKAAVLDLDSNRQNDVVLTTAEGQDVKMSIYFNNGDYDAGGVWRDNWAERPVQNPWRKNHQVEIADFNGDLGNDILGGRSFGARGVYVWYGSPGAGDYRVLQRQNVNADRGLYNGKAGDFDGDGDTDIMGPTTYAGQVYVYFANGAGPLATDANKPPTASFEVESIDGLTVTLRSTSTDPDGVITKHVWSAPPVLPSAFASRSPTPSITFPAPGTYTITLTVTDDELPLGATGRAQRTVTVDEVAEPAGEVVFAMNVGGRVHTTADGIRYERDTGVIGIGRTGKKRVTDPIAGTTEDDVYQSERWGHFGYAIDLPNGTYALTLQFCEISWTGAGRRVFSAFAEGAPVVTDLDPFAAAGHDAAYDVTATVTVSDGVLDLEFDPSVDNATLSGIVIRTAPSQAIAASAGLLQTQPPADLALRAFPNPSASAVTLEYGLAEAATVRLEVYDGLGRRVAILADGTHEAGPHRARFDGSGLPSGVYLWRLQVGDRFETGRLTLAR